MNNKNTRKKNRGGNKFKRVRQLFNTIKINKKMQKYGLDAENIGEKYNQWNYRKHIPNTKKNKELQTINNYIKQDQNLEQYGTFLDNKFRNKIKENEEEEEKEEEEKEEEEAKEEKEYIENITGNDKTLLSYIKFAVYTTKKSLWDNPIQVECLKKMETIKALTRLIVINYTWDSTITDETQIQENYNNFYKELIRTVLPILESVFDNYLKDGCEKTVPLLIEHVFGTNFSPENNPLLDKSYQTCNSIVPKIANQLKNHGFGNLSQEVTTELSEYTDQMLELCKEILIGAIKKKVDDTIKDLDIPKNIDTIKEIFNKEMVIHMLKGIKQQFYKIDRIDVRDDVEKINTKLDQSSIIKEKEEAIAKKLEKKIGKITIYDFYKNWKKSITKLLEDWTTEIETAIPDKTQRDSYYKAKCFINVLDIRLTTIIKNVCDIYKSDNLLCDEEMIKDIDGVLTKNDIKTFLQNLTIRILSKKSESFFKESILFHYMFDSNTVKNNPGFALSKIINAHI